MSVNIISKDTDRLVLEISIPIGTVMLEGEQRIEQVLNEAGAVASGELLKHFDTD
jgi:phosphotransferase system IIA component